MAALPSPMATGASPRPTLSHTLPHARAIASAAPQTSSPLPPSPSQPNPATNSPSHHPPPPTPTPTSFTFASSLPQTTPAKRSSPSVQDRISKRRSPSFPTAGTSSPTRPSASASPASADSAATPNVPLTATSPWGGPSASFQQPPTTASGPQAPAPAQAPTSSSFAQMQAHHRSHSVASASGSQPQSASTSFTFGEESLPPRLNTRRHSLTSAMLRRPFELTGEPDSATSSSGLQPQALPPRDQQPLQFTPTTADNRSLPLNRAAPTAVARSPAFPRGLEQEEVFGDLSLLGYPLPQSRPDQRAPERLADRPDEWGLVSELGPMSQAQLFSVGDAQFGAVGSANTAAAQRRAPDAPQDAPVRRSPFAPAGGASSFLARAAAATTDPSLAESLRDIEIRLARFQREHPHVDLLASQPSPQELPRRPIGGSVTTSDFLALIREARLRVSAVEGGAPSQARATADRGRESSSRRAAAPQPVSMLQATRPTHVAPPSSTPQAATAAAPGDVATTPATSSTEAPGAEALHRLNSRHATRRAERYSAIQDWRNNIERDIPLPSWEAPAGASMPQTRVQPVSAFGGASAITPTSGSVASGLSAPEPRAPSPDDDFLRRPRPASRNDGMFSPVFEYPSPALAGLGNGQQQEPNFPPAFRPLPSHTRLHYRWAQMRSGSALQPEQAQTAGANGGPSATAAAELFDHDAPLSFAPDLLDSSPRRAAARSVSAIRARALAHEQRMREMREDELQQERELDMAGAPPAAGLRPLLLASHAPFRASHNWDESGRPSNRAPEAAGPSNTNSHTGPSVASSARATAGDPPGNNAASSAAEVQARRRASLMTLPRRDGGMAYGAENAIYGEADASAYHSFGPATGSIGLGAFTPLPLGAYTPMAIPHQRYTTSANGARADGGDPVDLSDRSRRRTNALLTPLTWDDLSPRPPLPAAAPPNPVQPAAGASGAAQQNRPARDLSTTNARHLAYSSYSSYYYENIYGGLGLSRPTDPDDRAARLLTWVFASPNPQQTLEVKLRSSRDELRLHAEMTPETRTQMFTRIARAMQIVPAMTRRKYLVDVLAHSPWENAQIEGEKDECCAICQEDYEPAHSVSVTPCQHMYHAHCLERWIKTPNISSCPMCRRDLAVLGGARLLCDEGMAVAHKMWMETPADLVPVRDL